jgi:hypothetical protein
MPSSPTLPMVRAIEAAVRASADLAAAMGGRVRFYPTAREAGATLPFVLIDSLQSVADGTSCADGAEVFASISLWSKPAVADRGAQAYAMGAALEEALRAQLTVEGWDVDEWPDQVEASVIYNTEPDGSIRGRLDLRYLLTEQVP